MPDIPKPRKFRDSTLSYAARGECHVNEETGERIVDAGLDIYDGQESAAALKKFGRWLCRAAAWSAATKKSKSRAGVTVIEALVVIAILAVLVGLLVPAAAHFSSKSSETSAYLMTVTHDGHKFILPSPFLSRGSYSILHHPECQCRLQSTSRR